MFVRRIQDFQILLIAIYDRSHSDWIRMPLRPPGRVSQTFTLPRVVMVAISAG